MSDDDLRIEVVSGTPSPAELAAIVVALTPAIIEAGADVQPAVVAAWARAALLEGVGYPRSGSAAELAGRPGVM